MIHEICHASIVLPGRTIESGKIRFVDGRIVSVIDEIDSATEIAMPKHEVVDFSGDLIIPGLIDLHVHGCEGSDVMDGSIESLQKMAAGLLRFGTTAFLPTTMSAPLARLEEIAKVARSIPLANSQAEILGIHYEGPCIASNYKGAQKLAEDIDYPVAFDPIVKLITLAPEHPQSAAWIKLARDSNVIVAAGHSGANYEQMMTAMDAGVQRLTHAFNAMQGIHHRNPGLLTAALLDERTSLELIADGVHIHPAIIELVLRLTGPGRIHLVSDGTRAVGMPDGEYELGGQQVNLRQGRMTLTDGTLAGSASTLLDCVRFVVEQVGRPLHEAIGMAALNPARALELEDRIGSLLPGREATFLRLNQLLDLKEVWVKGRRVFKK